MPHLSPMNWIISILSFWTILFILSSNYWWSQNNKFFSPKSNSKSKLSSNSWKW